MRAETKEERLQRLKEEQEEHFTSVLYNIDDDSDTDDTTTTGTPSASKHGSKQTSIDSFAGSEVVLSALNFQNSGSTLMPVKREMSTVSDVTKVSELLFKDVAQ